MKEILALWMARNREYYRDKGSLFWSFVATPFIVIVLAVAFSSESQEVFVPDYLLPAVQHKPVFLPKSRPYS